MINTHTDAKATTDATVDSTVDDGRSLVPFRGCKLSSLRLVGTSGAARLPASTAQFRNGAIQPICEPIQPYIIRVYST